MKKLKRGDLCPCCGMPIKTSNPDVLQLLTWIAEHRRLPAPGEVKQLLDGKEGDSDADME